MFTGIVQTVAEIVAIEKKESFQTHIISLDASMRKGLETGASIAHNGVCLTVTEFHGDLVHFDLMQETLRVTNLGEVKVGDKVNIERAMQMGSEIGGHLLSGHVFCMAEVSNIIESENNYQPWFTVPDRSLMKYILAKGFIAIDGISLTIGEVTDDSFCVNLIPETLQRTTLASKKIGAKVNIELDSQTQAIVDTVERYLKQKDGN